MRLAVIGGLPESGDVLFTDVCVVSLAVNLGRFIDDKCPVNDCVGDNDDDDVVVELFGEDFFKLIVVLGDESDTLFMLSVLCSCLIVGTLFSISSIMINIEKRTFLNSKIIFVFYLTLDYNNNFYDMS